MKQQKTDNRIESDLRKEFFHTLSEKKIPLILVILFWVAWVVAFIFDVVTLNTLLMIILSCILVGFLFFIWIRTETRLNIALDVLEHELNKEEK